MTVMFYNTTSPNNKIIKDISDGYEVDNVEPFGEIDLNNPQLLMGSISSAYNYCYISEYDKYYFVDEPIRTQNGLSIYPLRIDSLMSNASQILELDAVIERQESIFNEYINDGTFVPDTREFIQCVNFSGGFNSTGELILITAGGVANI